MSTDFDLDRRTLALARLLQKAAGLNREGKPKISLEDAIFAVMYGMGTGLVPFRDFYVTDAGIMDGYRGLLKQVGRYGYIRYSFRELTTEERTFHDVGERDIAIACLLHFANEPDNIVTGYGFVRESERTVVEKGPNGQLVRKPKDPRFGSWGRVAQNRALKDALRHVPIPIASESQAGINFHNLLVGEAMAAEPRTLPGPVDADHVVLDTPLRGRRSYPDLKPSSADVAVVTVPVPDPARTSVTTTPPPSSVANPTATQSPQPPPPLPDDDDDGPLTDDDISDVQVPPSALSSEDEEAERQLHFVLDVMASTPYPKPVRDVSKWIAHLKAHLEEYGLSLEAVSSLVFNCTPESLREQDLRQLIGYFFEEEGQKLSANQRRIDYAKFVLATGP